jgi:hypothetical protein
VCGCPARKGKSPGKAAQCAFPRVRVGEADSNHDVSLSLSPVEGNVRARRESNGRHQIRIRVASARMLAREYRPISSSLLIVARLRRRSARGHRARPVADVRRAGRLPRSRALLYRSAAPPLFVAFTGPRRRWTCFRAIRIRPLVIVVSGAVAVVVSHAGVIFRDGSPASSRTSLPSCRAPANAEPPHSRSGSIAQE